MLLYKIINDMSEKTKEDKAEPEIKKRSKNWIVRELKKLDTEYKRMIALKERQSASRSRTYN